MYLAELVARTGAPKARGLVRSLAEAVQLVDEANEITDAVRAADGLRFALEAPAAKPLELR